MGNRIKTAAKTINNKGGVFTFLRAQFSSQISSLTDYIVSFTLVNAFGLLYGYATLFGNVSGGIINCIINYKWTFKAKGSKKKHVAIKYLMVWVVNLFLNWQGTILATEFVLNWIPTDGLPNFVVNNIFMIPKAIVSLLVGFGWNYNMQRIFVYKDRDYKKYFIRMGICKANSSSVSKEDNCDGVMLDQSLDRDREDK